MSDERLRQLERRWKETGTEEDELAYLREQVRAKQLPRADLVLAARLGYPLAQVLLDDQSGRHYPTAEKQFKTVKPARLALQEHSHEAVIFGTGRVVEKLSNHCLDELISSSPRRKPPYELLRETQSLTQAALREALKQVMGQAERASWLEMAKRLKGLRDRLRVSDLDVHGKVFDCIDDHILLGQAAAFTGKTSAQRSSVTCRNILVRYTNAVPIQFRPHLIIPLFREELVPWLFHGVSPLAKRMPREATAEGE